VRALAAAIPLLLVLSGSAHALGVAKPAPPTGVYTCYVFDISIGPDGAPISVPFPSVLGTLQLRASTYRTRLGGGRWLYDRRGGKPRFTSGPLARLRVTWDVKPQDKVWRLELQYRGQRHFCDKRRAR
jgi:hypothetical protein